MSEFKIDQNVTLTKLFDNNVLILMNEIELSNQYTPKEQLFIHCSFLEIKRLISRNYFIDKFKRDDQIKFVANKINAELKELTFLKDESNIRGKFFSSLISVLIFAQENEYYECEANLYKYLLNYFTPDYLNEKIKLLIVNT